jgi:hypothetical protein
MVNIRSIANQFMKGGRGAGGAGGTGRRSAGGGMGGGVGGTGTGGAGGRRTQDEAIGRGIRKLLGRR